MSIICDKFNLGRFGEIRTVNINDKGWYVGSDIIRALEFNEGVAETIWKYVPAEHIYNSGTDWGLLVDWTGIKYLDRKSPLRYTELEGVFIRVLSNTLYNW